MDKTTILFETHKAMGGRMVPFGGWSMPLHYGSQLEEHHQVRRDAGMFDVSHRSGQKRRGTKFLTPWFNHGQAARLLREARAMAKPYLERHPDGAHAARIRSVLE